MARPNVLEPLIEETMSGGEKPLNEGWLADEIIGNVLSRTSRGTPRGVKNALLSMFNKGRVGRAFEYVYDERGRPILRRMRYWNRDAFVFGDTPDGFELNEYDNTPRKER